MNKRSLSVAQQNIVDELVLEHELDPADISFQDPMDTRPIFGFVAVCHMARRLTDIRDITCTLSDWTPPGVSAKATCTVVLPNDLTRTMEGVAVAGEEFPDGTRADNYTQICWLAQTRAVRTAIRSVGIDLWKAHKKWKQSGGPVEGHTGYDARHPFYAEIHVLATELGLIVDGDKTEYRRYLAEIFEGRTSAKELSDEEIQRLLVGLRAIARVQRSSRTAAAGGR